MRDWRHEQTLSAPCHRKRQKIDNCPSRAVVLSAPIKRYVMARHCGPGASRPLCEDRIPYSAPSRTLHTQFLPSYRHVRVAVIIFTLAIAVSNGVSSTIWAQTTGDDVHIS